MRKLILVAFLFLVTTFIFSDVNPFVGRWLFRAAAGGIEVEMSEDMSVRILEEWWQSRDVDSSMFGKPITYGYDDRYFYLYT